MAEGIVDRISEVNIESDTVMRGAKDIKNAVEYFQVLCDFIPDPATAKRHLGRLNKLRIELDAKRPTDAG